MRILYTVHSGSTVEFVTEESEVYVGRQVPPGPGTLEIKDGKISSRHARLTLEDGEVWIEDLGSTNGTWVDRRKIRVKTKLTPDSIVLLGQTVLQLAPAGQAPGAAEAAPAAAPSADTQPAAPPGPAAAPAAESPTPPLGVAAPAPAEAAPPDTATIRKDEDKDEDKVKEEGEESLPRQAKKGRRAAAKAAKPPRKAAGALPAEGVTAAPPAASPSRPASEPVSASAPAAAPPSASCSLDAPPGAETPLEIVESAQPLHDLVLAGASPESVRRRLAAVFTLSSAIEGVDSPEDLAAILLENLFEAFPMIRRGGHCGLLLGKALILKAFRPDDQPPSCSLTLARHVMAEGRACLWRLGAPSPVEASQSLIDTGTQSAMYAPLAWRGEILGVLYLDAVSPGREFDLDDLRLLQTIATQAGMFVKTQSLQANARREAAIKSRLLAQFPARIAERMARQPGRLAIVSERVEPVTALFSDVRSFTRLTSRMEPEIVVQMLNDMFHDLTPIILKHNGTVDKYVGDAVLAVFGSPDPDDLQWEHAVRAALEMQSAMRALAAERWKGRTPFEIGIGIHTGAVIHGFIGAPERMEYTAIGETINLASRFCSGAAAGEILISPETYARLHHVVDVVHPAREIETKHEGRIKAYLVRGLRGGPR